MKVHARLGAWSRCGRRLCPERLSTRPDEVTCEVCLRSLAAEDRVVAERKAQEVASC